MPYLTYSTDFTLMNMAKLIFKLFNGICKFNVTSVASLPHDEAIGGNMAKV